MADEPPKIPPRKKKPPRETRYDIYQFQTKEEGYSMIEFFEVYSERLPVFAMVTQGCLGLTDLETFSVEQTLFCHAFTKQKRVVARDAKGRMISIPEDYPLNFKVVLSSSRVGKEQSLAEILSENKLPLQVQFSVPKDVVLLIDSDKKKATDLTNLLLAETYEETFVLANGVYGKTLEVMPMIVPLYLKDLEVSTVTGAVGMSDTEWKKLYSDLEAKLKNVKVTPNMGNREIAMYSDKLSSDSEDHIYQYIEPTDYISFARLSSRNATDDEKYTCPYFHKRNQRAIALVSELKERVHLDIKDISNRDQKRRRPMNRSISETTANCKQRTIPPDLPPRSRSFFERSKKKLKDITASKSAEVGERTPSQNPSNLSDMTIDDFSRILKQLRLGKYVDKFKRRQVDGAIAKELTEDILREEFHMSGFEIIKFMKFTSTGHIPT